MYIYEKKNTGDLFHDLKKMGRDDFSYDGASALMEYLEQLAEDCGEPQEYDPIAYCCEYAEWQESEYEARSKEYDEAPKIADFECENEFNEDLIEWLEGETTVIKFNGGIIVGGF